MITIQTTTYGCVCGYRLEGIDPYSDYYITTFGVSGGTCASCKQQKMGVVLDASDMSIHTVNDPNSLSGQTVTETTVDPNTLQQTTTERPLTEQEIADEQSRINAAIDILSAKEYSQAVVAVVPPPIPNNPTVSEPVDSSTVTAITDANTTPTTNSVTI